MALIISPVFPIAVTDANKEPMKEQLSNTKKSILYSDAPQKAQSLWFPEIWYIALNLLHFAIVGQNVTSLNTELVAQRDFDNMEKVCVLLNQFLRAYKVAPCNYEGIADYERVCSVRILRDPFYEDDGIESLLKSRTTLLAFSCDYNRTNFIQLSKGSRSGRIWHLFENALILENNIISKWVPFLNKNFPKRADSRSFSPAPWCFFCSKKPLWTALSFLLLNRKFCCRVEKVDGVSHK